MDDEKFLDSLADVVWRFETYHQYGKNPRKAIKALSKRVPGYKDEHYRKMFELDLKLLATTISVVEKAPKNTRPGQKFSDYSDVDLEFVQNNLRTEFPDQSDDYLKRHLGMVIYWYYLR